MHYAQSLDLLIRAGEISAVVEQPRVTLGVPENEYRPDFLVIPRDERPYFVDVKGMETPAFKKNKRLWSAYGRLPLVVVKRKGKGWQVTEKIDPTS